MEETKVFTYNDFPQAMTLIYGKVDRIEQIVKELADGPKEPADTWMDVDGLIHYLPEKPAKQTIYGWVSAKKIPYHKGGSGRNGKKLRFRKSEIDDWLSSGKVKCEAELADEANVYLTKRNGVKAYV